MNNEPVAWMDKESNITMIGGIYPKKLEQYLSVLESRIIALESHPAKTLTDDPLVNFKPVWQEKSELTLTDEEIRKVADEVFKDYKNWHHYQIDFARAILRKAQEK